MSSINDNKNHSYFDSHYLKEESDDSNTLDVYCSDNSSTFSPYNAPYFRSMSSINTPYGTVFGNGRVGSRGPSNAVRNKQFESLSSISGKYSVVYPSCAVLSLKLFDIFSAKLKYF